MRITHQYKNIKIKKDVEEDTGLLLGNDLGNYLYLTNDKETRYQGFFYADADNYQNELLIYKIIDQIDVLNRSKLVEIKNSFFRVERKYEDDLTEEYFMPSGYNSLCLKTNKKVTAEIVLDIRHPYDCRQMGRFYEVEIEGDCAVIKFTKRRDWQEDGLGDKKEFTLYIAIKTNKNKFKRIGEFFSKHYQKDQERNSYPWDRFVYRAIEADFRNIVFSVAKTSQKAIEEAEKVFSSFERLQKREKNDFNKKLKLSKISDEEINMAYLCAQNSIRALMVENNKHKGVYAGLPWFFQSWNRDEAVSLFQIYKLNKKLFQEIVLLQLETVMESGQLQTQRTYTVGNNNLQSSDTLGWTAHQILKAFHKDRLPKDFRIDIINGLEKAVSNLLQNRTENDLAVSLKGETWMDSMERSGNRIEIQACRLQIYNLMYKLTKNDQYKILREDLKAKVCEKFYVDGALLDSPDDKTARPNVFLAAYLYPQLLDKEKWEICFDRALEKLYLDWGGISTIEKTSNEFFSGDTGENNASYHRGNSWFWINNLVALVLYRTNAHKYSMYINSIMEASTNDILYKGIIGHHSEISGAEKQTSAGCGAQLWSAAMYLEVFDEILGG